MIFIAWVLLCIGAGAVAHAKGRSGFGYFILALIVSPLIGFLISAAMPSKYPKYYVDYEGVRRRTISERQYYRQKYNLYKDQGLIPPPNEP